MDRTNMNNDNLNSRNLNSTKGTSKNQPIHRDRPAIPDDGYDVKADVRTNGRADFKEVRTADVQSHVHEQDSTLSRVEAKFERLYDHVENMLTTQMDLARTEIGEKVERVENGMISLTSGGVATFFGVQFILGAITFALALVMPLWGAALIVGGVVLAIGLIMLNRAKEDLKAKNLKPERTMRSMRETAEAVRREI